METVEETALLEPRSKREVAQDAARPERPEATTSLDKQLFDLAWPIATAMIGEVAMGLVDTKLVGGLGPSALGGVGIATTLMFLGYSLVFGTMRGVKVATSHAIGEGRPLDGFVFERAGLILSFGFGLVFLILCRDVSGLLRLIGTDPAVIPYTRDFLAMITLGAPASCAISALIQHRQATNDSRTPMIVGLLGNVVNATLAWSLIYGHLGLPALGVRGGGLATASVELMELTALGLLFLRDEKRAKAAASPNQKVISLRAALREVSDLGLPTGLQYGIEMLAFTTFTAVLGNIGGAELAGHQVALAVIRVSFLPGVAVAEAASVLVGQSLGRRRLDQADAVVKGALKMAVAFMAACGVVFALGGSSIASFFATDPSVLHVARNLLLLAAIFQVLDAVSIVLRGSLRGAKDVKVVALLGIAIIWTCIPTAAYFLGRVAGLGALGGWIGFIGETTLGSVIFWPRWKHGGWRKKYAAR